jgi:hypothetical protein
MTAPTTRHCEMVLATVRGTEDALFLVSPFTSAKDQAWADFIGGLDALRVEYERPTCEQVIADAVRSPMTNVGDVIRWADGNSRRDGPSGGPSRQL